jgi:hypothetical protein
MGGGLVDAVDAERHVEDDACHVLAQIEEMGECVSGITVAAEALDCAPDAGEGGEEPKETGAGRVALGVVTPFVDVEAEEELNVLGGLVRTENREGLLTPMVYVSEQNISPM